MKDKIIAPSTRDFYRQGRRIPGYRFFDFLHGYVYARWTYLYIGIGIGEHPIAKRLAPLIVKLSKWFGKQENSRVESKPKITLADTYHGKVIPLQAAHQLVSVKENINLPNLEKIVPYPLARDIILQNPDHIVVIDCPCRSARPNPCLPLDVCLIIGEPFASLVIEHHPQRSRWITSHEAQEILRQEDERGHVHHAFFKDAMLGRFYAICNCCSCCCGAMQAHKNGNPMLASSGYICQVDADLCIACGECNTACQFGALSLGNSSVQVNEAECMGCGVCISQCEQDALSLVHCADKGEPLEILNLFDVNSS
ncbi:MAG: 4Fe-4S binding protein [Anaerolineales bacterium]|nr:4Fe-4S binding protein [Anaerolineales bacterium]